MDKVEDKVIEMFSFVDNVNKSSSTYPQAVNKFVDYSCNV